MNILAVGAHHDDIELGCGGALARLRKEGHQTYGIILTNSVVNSEELGIFRNAETAEEENKHASQKIGITMLRMENPVQGDFLRYEPHLMKMLEQIISQYNIDTLFIHWLHDMNTDHAAAARISITAGRHLPRIVMYRSNWYQLDRPFNENLFIDITDYVDTKRDALECYAGEIKRRGTEWIDSFQYQNYQCGFKSLHKKINKKSSAESFEILKWTI
jgi:LmbE family N-acetylglucosaminyl deacetylase